MRLIKLRTVTGPHKNFQHANLRGSHIKTYTTKRVPTDWRQHFPKVYRMLCNKINNITLTIQATAEKHKQDRQSVETVHTTVTIVQSGYYVDAPYTLAPSG